MTKIRKNAKGGQMTVISGSTNGNVVTPSYSVSANRGIKTRVEEADSQQVLGDANKLLKGFGQTGTGVLSEDDAPRNFVAGKDEVKGAVQKMEETGKTPQKGSLVDVRC